MPPSTPPMPPGGNVFPSWPTNYPVTGTAPGGVEANAMIGLRCVREPDASVSSCRRSSATASIRAPMSPLSPSTGSGAIPPPARGLPRSNAERPAAASRRALEWLAAPMRLPSTAALAGARPAE
jgi:hypothetical protein